MNLKTSTPLSPPAYETRTKHAWSPVRDAHPTPLTPYLRDPHKASPVTHPYKILLKVRKVRIQFHFPHAGFSTIYSNIFIFTLL